MKPTEKQSDLISLISGEIQWWATTNDINSPSHWSLIDEFVYNEIPEDLLSIDGRDALSDALAIIMSTIRQNP